jgi:Transglutaminase-like superfamily
MAGVARFFALAPAERLCTLEAAVSLLVVRLAFGLLPFAAALRLLRIAQGETGAGRVAARDALDVGRAVSRAARAVPFRAVCLQQAFAALLMLRRRGLAATVQFGLARDPEGDLKAHAWSRCGELPVTGVAVARGFVPVAAFVA